MIDGPFAETKELLAGYWVWQVKSLDEAIEWAKRIPNPTRRGGHRRDPPGLRGRRLRRGAHARAAREGAAPARRRSRRTSSASRTTATVATTDVNRTIEAVWRIESARLIAGLARIVRDVGLAEDLAQEALVAALEQWPESGVPDNPGAWLMATGQAPGDRSPAPSRRPRAQDAGARRARSRSAARRRAPISRPRSTIRSTTTSCASSSPPATRCSRPTRGSRSRCACSAA